MQVRQLLSWFWYQLFCVFQTIHFCERRANNSNCVPGTGESLLIKMAEKQFSNAKSDINDI